MEYHNASFVRYVIRSLPRQYNAHKHDLILKNVCYSDGTCSGGGDRRDIVHRKCYEFKKPNKNVKVDGLKPKLLNKNNPIFRVETQFKKSKHHMPNDCAKYMIIL
eukprot:387343_1